MRAQPPVRAIWDAMRVPGAQEPYDTVHYRVAFPAAAPDPGADPVLGLVPPARDAMPIVVLHPNFNLDGVGLRWLERALALAGNAVVTPQWVGPMFDGRPGLPTGIDVTTLRHCYLDALRTSLAGGLVADSLDLERIVLGGHSAGGTLALLASDGVAGAFSYGGHTRAQGAQGHGVDHYLPLPGDSPLLLMGGTADGVVTAIAQAQGHDVGATPMAETYARAAASGRPTWLLMVDGADHYSFVAEYDGSSGRGYLEPEGPRPASEVRAVLAPFISSFVAAAVGEGAFAELGEPGMRVL